MKRDYPVSRGHCIANRTSNLALESLSEILIEKYTTLMKVGKLASVRVSIEMSCGKPFCRKNLDNVEAS